MFSIIKFEFHFKKWVKKNIKIGRIFLYSDELWPIFVLLKLKDMQIFCIVNDVVKPNFIVVAIFHAESCVELSLFVLQLATDWDFLVPEHLGRLPHLHGLLPSLCLSLLSSSIERVTIKILIWNLKDWRSINHNNVML